MTHCNSTTGPNYLELSWLASLYTGCASYTLVINRRGWLAQIKGFFCRLKLRSRECLIRRGRGVKQAKQASVCLVRRACSVALVQIAGFGNRITDARLSAVHEFYLLIELVG